MKEVSMPQNNVLPDWRATYPNDAPVQKPSGVTVSTTATAPRVPNKFTYSAGTVQLALQLDLETKSEEVKPVDKKEEPKVKEEVKEEVEEEEDEEEEDHPHRGGGAGRHRRR